MKDLTCLTIANFLILSLLHPFISQFTFRAFKMLFPSMQASRGHLQRRDDGLWPVRVGRQEEPRGGEARRREDERWNDLLGQLQQVLDDGNFFACMTVSNFLSFSRAQLAETVFLKVRNLCRQKRSDYLTQLNMCMYLILSAPWTRSTPTFTSAPTTSSSPVKEAGGEKTTAVF